MYTITKEFRFEAAHHLPSHDGKCRRLHGHSFKGRVVLKSAVLVKEGPKRGMVQDFADVSKVLNPIVETYLDHQYLNETLGIDDPTSENVAAWLFHSLKPQLPLLVAVEVDETCTSSARFDLEVPKIAGI